MIMRLNEYGSESLPCVYVKCVSEYFSLESSFAKLCTAN